MGRPAGESLTTSEAPKVSVIVPHYNDLAGLEICLRALMVQTYPRDRFEVIVGDNASPQGIEAVRAVAGDRAKVVLVPERGAGPARNGAVAHAGGEILAFIDSDCVAEPAWIEEGVKALSAHDFVGGQVTVLVGDEARMTPVEAFERVFAFDFQNYIEKKGFTGSGNLFCPARMFADVGGFGVGISEDTEWSIRAQQRGYRLGYAPTAVVGHPARVTWDELVRKWRRINRENYGLRAGTANKRLKWLVKALLMPASALAHTPKMLLSRKLSGAGNKLGGLQVLWAIRFWRLADAFRIVAEERAQAEGQGPVAKPSGAA